MNPTIAQSQLIQLFSDLHKAQVAYSKENQKPGNKEVRFYSLDDLQVDDLRPTPPTPAAYTASGDPLYVVQTVYL